MKKLLLLASILLLTTACGSDNTVVKQIPGPAGEAGKDGAAGSKGADGEAGLNGNNALVSIVSSAPGCPAGGITLLSGTDADNDGVLTVSDSNLASAEVCNGVQGEQGQAGNDAPPTAFTPVGIIDPCGNNPSVFDEVFLQLSNGVILASFSDNANGLNTRFSVLTNGTYQTTDGSGCVFSVNNGVVSW